MTLTICDFCGSKIDSAFLNNEYHYPPGDTLLISLMDSQNRILSLNTEIIVYLDKRFDTCCSCIRKGIEKQILQIK